MSEPVNTHLKLNDPLDMREPSNVRAEGLGATFISAVLAQVDNAHLFVELPYLNTPNGR